MLHPQPYEDRLVDPGGGDSGGEVGADGSSDSFLLVPLEAQHIARGITWRTRSRDAHTHTWLSNGLLWHTHVKSNKARTIQWAGTQRTCTEPFGTLTVKGELSGISYASCLIHSAVSWFYSERRDSGWQQWGCECFGAASLQPLKGITSKWLFIYSVVNVWFLAEGLRQVILLLKLEL